MAHSLRLLSYLTSQDPEPLRDPRPASRLIQQTARKVWQMLTFNICGNLSQAAEQAASLGMAPLALDLLSNPASPSIDWSTRSFPGGLAHLTAALNTLPRHEIFLLRLASAALMKRMQILDMDLGSLAMGHDGPAAQRG